MLFTWSVAPRSLILGACFSVFVAILTYSIFVEHHEAARKSLLPRVHYLVFYLAVMLASIYLASFRVAVSIVTGRINPRIVHFRTRLSSEIARALLANSITLTPGTVTLDLDEDHLVVHWLNAKTTHSKYAGRLIKGRMEGWLKRIWM
jgi:multicomponent Na+:H+ antiporter subunit E